MFIQQLISDLRTRKQSLERLKAKLERDIPSFPEGILNASVQSHPRKGFVYFSADGHGHRTYIKKSSDHLAEKLAQKEYDVALLDRVEREIRLIDGLLKQMTHNSPEDLYPSLRPARKAVVIPFIYPDDEYIRVWKDRSYEGKSFLDNEPEHYTERGLRVRSKSEELIANALDQMNIPYKYECPLNLPGWGCIYPDFTVLHVKKRKEVVWEHFGMMDNPKYASAATRKVSKYMSEGYYPGENLILTFETSDVTISTRQITEICRHYLSGQS